MANRKEMYNFMVKNEVFSTFFKTDLILCQ